MSLHGNETPGRPPAAGEMLGARAATKRRAAQAAQIPAPE